MKGDKKIELLPRLADESPPLSFGQERLWFLEQYDPDSQAYNRPAHLRLLGSLNLEILEQALNQVVRRHEVLRTSFATVGNNHIQRIDKVYEVSLPLMDLSALDASARQQEAIRLTSEESLCPFDLTTGPLFRTRVIRLEKDEHLLLLTLHHIVFDGWSQTILHKELSKVYFSLIGILLKRAVDSIGVFMKFLKSR